MSNTKIMVLSLKEIIRSALFAIVGLVLIILMIFLFLPKDKGTSSNSYNEGTYSAEILLHNSPTNVLVTVSNSKITTIALENPSPEQALFYPLIEPTLAELSSQIIESQTTTVTVSPETAYTSKVLLDAIDTALSQAVVSK